MVISNYEQRPVPLAAEQAETKLARVNVAMSWRGDLRTRAKRLAKAAGLNVNAFVEALIAKELRSPELALTILTARGSVKLRME